MLPLTRSTHWPSVTGALARSCLLQAAHKAASRASIDAQDRLRQLEGELRRLQAAQGEQAGLRLATVRRGLGAGCWLGCWRGAVAPGGAQAWRALGAVYAAAV